MREITDLITKAEKFMQTAEAAFSLGDYDSCVSRAYYAMFFLAEAALLTKGLRASTHKGIISLFGEHFVHSGIFERKLGKILNEAHDRRLQGDYASGFGIDRNEAQKTLNDAYTFIATVRAYLETFQKQD